MQRTRLLASFLLTALVFSACVPVSPAPVVTPSLGQPALTETPSPSPTATPTLLPTIDVPPASLHGLTIQVWHAFAGPASDLFASQVARFNADNEWGILVNPIGYGDAAGLSDFVDTFLGSDRSPDLVAALPEQILAWDARGAVVDLQPYLVDPKWGLADNGSADIPAIFWAQDTLNGRQLGIPAQRSARFILYNQTWAHELGFTNPPASAEEFRQQACAANASFQKDADPRNDGYGGWIIDTHWQTTYSWLLAFGGGVADGSAYGLRTDPNLATLQFIKGLFDKHCAWLSTEPTPFDSFARRSALFISADLAELPAEKASMASLKNPDAWTVLPFPGPRGNVVIVYGPSYSLLKTTPEKQLATWLFVRWLLSPENQASWVEATGLFSLRNSALDMIGSYRLALPQWDAAVRSLSSAQTVPQLASWRKARYVLEDGLTVLFQENLPVDRLPSLLAEMDAMIQELK